MKRMLSRRFFVVAACFISLAAGAARPRCDACGGRMGRQQWTYGGLTVCSEQCVDALRPTCSVCNTRIRGKYSEADGKIFCGKACFLTTLPKCEICKDPIEKGFSVTRHMYCERCSEKQPTCFSCSLPAAYPTRLKDGREICNNCRRWGVKTQEMAVRNYERARRQLEAWTGLKVETLPELVLVDKTEMEQLSKKLRKTDSPISIRGLYSRQTMMSRKGLFGAWKEDPSLDQEKIYIIDHLNDEIFRVTATHELMHDLIHEHFPRLKEAPLWLHEGICQQASAELCRRRNYGDTLYGLDHCPDPDYGDGYRYIKSIGGIQGWSNLRHWLETVDVDALPKTAPQ
jgi:hypothetical protein